MIHWSWLIFIGVVLFLLYKIRKSSNEGGGDYSIDLETPFWLIILIAFILIWGGIFWW
jgi:hypothetical protein